MWSPEQTTPMPHLAVDATKALVSVPMGRAQPVSLGTKCSFHAASLRLGMHPDGQMEGLGRPLSNGRSSLIFTCICFILLSDCISLKILFLLGI